MYYVIFTCIIRIAYSVAIFYDLKVDGRYNDLNTLCKLLFVLRNTKNEPTRERFPDIDYYKPLGKISVFIHLLDLSSKYFIF